MTAFADTSAVVKIYFDEAGSPRMRRFGWMVVSELVLVELPSALWKKVRMGQLERDDARTLVDLFFHDYSLGDVGRYLPVRADERLLRSAADFAEEYGLRAYDAVQLASAVAVRAVDDSVDTFVCADGQLAGAAEKSGFTITDLGE